MEQSTSERELRGFRLLVIPFTAVFWLAGLPMVSGAPAGQSGKAETAVELPQTAAEVAPFVAGMNDQQARAALIRVLDERVRASGEDEHEDMLVASEQATAKLSARLRELWAARGAAVSAPSLLWHWLTGGGADPTAPLRAAAGAMVLIGIGWAGQAAASWAFLTMRSRRRVAPMRGAEIGDGLVMLLRFVGLLGAMAVAHAIFPEHARPSRLAALALALTFAGTWISATAIAFVQACARGEAGAPGGAARPGLALQVSLAVLFGGLFASALLRYAGASADAQLIVALLAWPMFGALLLHAVSRSPADRPPPAESAGSDAVGRFLDRRGPLLVRLAFAAILLLSPVVALLRGPAALWSGIASFALIGVLLAALDVTSRAARPADLEASAPGQPLLSWTVTLWRASRILLLVGFTFATAWVWRVDLFHTAHTHLGGTVVRAVVAMMITVVLCFLVWEVIRTALARSLGPTQATSAHGEEGGGTAATRLQTFGPLLRNFLFVVVVTVGLLVCLTSMGVDIGPLLAGAGVIGIALGLGAQTLVRDIISGVFFLAEDAFRIGEYIEIGSTRGTVEGIAIRSLKLRHHRGPIHTVPFGEIKQLTNNSRDWVIMKLEFLLAFDTDLKKVKRIVKEIDKDLQAHPELGHALLGSVKSQGVRRMEPTGMVVGFKFMAKPGSEVFMLRREVYQRVRDAFEEHGIHFARPQVMVAGPAAAVADQVGAASVAAAAPA